MSNVNWTRIIRAQGCYYLIGGLWPFLHFRSFQAVVGPKPDRFQVEVTSALFMAVGTALLTERKAPGVPLDGLAALTAAGTVVVEARNRRALRPVFLGEALLETAFVASAIASGVRSARWRRERLRELTRTPSSP